MAEDAFELQLLIRDSSLPPEHPRLADKVWAHYQASRERWRAQEDQSLSRVFPPQPLYVAASAYFGGIGQTGRLFKVLEDGAQDAMRSGSLGYWRDYQLRLAAEAARVGNGPRALAALDRIHARYRVPASPEGGLSPDDRAWTAYLLALRYAYGSAQGRSRQMVLRDARFVLKTVQQDRQFRLPYKCCWVPALKMLPPLQRATAKAGDAELYSRIGTQIAEAREAVLSVKDKLDFQNPLPGSLFQGDHVRSLGTSGFLYGVDELLDEEYEGGRTGWTKFSPARSWSKREKQPVPHWPLFRAALAQWKAALHLGRAEDRRTSYERAKKRLARLNVHYQEAGERRAAADGLIRARHRFRLAKAREAELAGEYEQALAGYEEVVAWSERVRESLEPEQRLYFFQGYAKPAYLGRIRVRARLQRAQGGQGGALLAAIQSYRGRQLLEQVPGSEQGALTPTVAELQRDLGADEGRLVVLDLETTWLSVLLDDSELRVVLQPDAARVRALARQARRQLVEGKAGEGRQQLLEALL
ncbi:hypothetical protein, partial [Thiohalorhabdus methylotrophus]